MEREQVRGASEESRDQFCAVSMRRDVAREARWSREVTGVTLRVTNEFGDTTSQDVSC